MLFVRSYCCLEFVQNILRYVTTLKCMSWRNLMFTLERLESEQNELEVCLSSTYRVLENMAMNLSTP
jgi:hypothetical protein